MRRVQAEFLVHQGMPNCCGAIDVTHFHLELPPGRLSAFSSYEKHLSYHASHGGHADAVH